MVGFGGHTHSMRRPARTVGGAPKGRAALIADAHRAGNTAGDDVTGQFRDSLAGKITLPALALALVPTLAIGALSAISLFVLASRIDGGIDRAATDSAFSELGPARAEQAAVFQRGVDTYLTARINDVVDLAQAREVADPVPVEPPADDEAAPDDGDQTGESGQSVDPLTAFLNGARAKQPALLAIDVTDAGGGLVATTGSSDELGLRDEEWWVAASEAGAFVGSPTFDLARDTVVFDIAVRVTAPSGEPAGVVHAVVDGGTFESLADDEKAHYQVVEGLYKSLEPDAYRKFIEKYGGEHPDTSVFDHARPERVGDQVEGVLLVHRQDVHQTLGHARVPAKLADLHPAQGRELGGLEENRIAHGQGGGHLDQRQGEGKRVGRDDGHQAVGLVEVVGALVRVEDVAR